MKIVMKHKVCARSLALEVLLSLSTRLHLQASLDNHFRKYSLSQQDLSLCTELAYGTMRYYFRLDAILNHLLPKLEKLPKAVAMLLRQSLYELLFLERVPHHATLNFAVEQSKKTFGNKISQVVNAALRECIRLGDKVHERSFYKKTADFYALPTWLYGYFVKAYGEEITHLLCLRSLQRPKTAWRINSTHSDSDFIHDYISKLDGAQSVGQSGYVFLDIQAPKNVLGQNVKDLISDGALSLQAAGSQIALQECYTALPSLFDYPLWDACAGQGGKSMAMAEAGVNIFLASDVHSKRLLLLKDNADRLNVKIPNILCGAADSLKLKNFDGNILLDVPCSGFGTLARRPEIRLFRSYDDVQDLICLQSKILHNAYAQLDSGRHIIYMTCTLNPHENELQIEKFLQVHDEAQCVFTWQTPHDHSYLEGMFVAIIKK